jgi:membrane protein required for colicin V production
MSVFNGFDIAVLFIILGSAFLSLNKGFISSVMSITVWIGSFLITSKIYSSIDEILLDKFHSKFLSYVFGGGVIWFSTLIILSIVRFIILRNTKSLRDGFADKILGLLFGFFRGGAIAVIVFLISSIMVHAFKGGGDDEELMPDFIVDAASYTYLRTSSDYILRYFGDDFIYKMKKNQENMSEEALYSVIEILSKDLEKDMIESLKDLSIRGHNAGKSERDIAIDVIQNLLQFHRHNGNEEILMNKKVQEFNDLFGTYKDSNQKESNE